MVLASASFTGLANKNGKLLLSGCRFKSVENVSKPTFQNHGTIVRE